MQAEAHGQTESGRIAEASLLLHFVSTTHVIVSHTSGTRQDLPASACSTSACAPAPQQQAVGRHARLLPAAAKLPTGARLQLLSYSAGANIPSRYAICRRSVFQLCAANSAVTYCAGHNRLQKPVHLRPCLHVLKFSQPYRLQTLSRVHSWSCQDLICKSCQTGAVLASYTVNTLLPHCAAAQSAL